MQRSLAGTGTPLVAITPGSVEQLQLFRNELDLQVPLLSDPDWQLHQALGLDRGSARAVFGSPGTWLAYAKLTRDLRLRRPEQDAMRLGGTAVVDAEGRLAWLSRSRNPGDYADPAEIVRQVELAESARPAR